MIHIQRFTLVFSVLALSFAPVASAGDGISEPSVLESALGAILDILVPEIEDTLDPAGAIPAEAPDAGPQIVYVG